ncbi:MAG TPA: hypothetical protein VKR31_06230 [Rhizomicrobium sp.]|nr:hypothetical protein [Rhizomicrobium sp.]
MKRPFYIAATALALAATGFSAQAAKPSIAASEHMLRMPPTIVHRHQPIADANSPVGLWHTVNTLPDGTFFLEAYTMWHSDGTFEEAANRDPRAADAPALGVWSQSGNTVTLSLAVAWLYDGEGNFTGTLNLTETYKVKDHGDKLDGTFDAKFYDTQGNLQQEVTGHSKANRLGG